MKHRLFAILLTTFSTLAACGAAQKMAVGPQVSEARATIEQSQGSAGATHVVVRVHNLAPPGKVGPDAHTYVVWARSGDAVRKLGALQLDGDDGMLETTTSLPRSKSSDAARAVEVFITAEPSASTNEPWGEKLIWGEIRGS